MGGALVQSCLAVAVTFVVAVLIGYRPDAGLADWFGVAGIVLLFALALTWLTVALGVAADSVETASNLPMPLVLLPFLKRAGFTFTIMVGDNIYGSERPQDFQKKFEIPYKPLLDAGVVRVRWPRVWSGVLGARIPRRRIPRSRVPRPGVL